MKQQSYVKKANRRLFLKKVKAFWQKQGFYIVLFLCVCAVGSALFFASDDGLMINLKNNEEDSPKNQLDTSDEITVVDQTELSEYLEDREKEVPGGIYYLEDEDSKNKAMDQDIEDKTGQVNPQNDQESQETSGEKEIDQEIEPVAEEMGEINFPVINGEIYKSYAMDQVVYSETLKEFRTHSGIDILGELGSNVLAFLPGTVESVEEDEQWGVVVTIDHGKGLKSIYANLEDAAGIEKGRYVLSGDIIGTIGQTASIEASDPPHLHFEIKVNNKNIDPARYIDE